MPYSTSGAAADNPQRMTTKDASETMELSNPTPNASVWLTNSLTSSLMRWSGLSAASP